MKKCQRDLDPDETGFLLDGQLPEINVEDFKATLRIIGGSEKKQRPPKVDHDSGEASETISDACSEVSKFSTKLRQSQEDCQSQQSFGPSSNISTNSKVRVSLSPHSSKEIPPVNQSQSTDISKGWKTASQEEINDLINRV